MRTWSLWICAALLLSGCPSINPYYERAVRIVNLPETPTEGQIEGALRDIESAVAKAQGDLEWNDIETHDQVAYFIPLAEIARARLYARVDQIVNAEDSCWQAIDAAERYLGKRLRHTAEAQSLFSDYSAFFRREKIRRHAFALLEEVYRRAGERDLELLMQAQISFSGAYLDSESAHREEEYVREAENASWVRKNDQFQESFGHAITVFALAVGEAGEQLSVQVQIQNLEEQLARTHNFGERARIHAELNRLRGQSREIEVRYEQAFQQEEIRHQQTAMAIDANFSRTFSQALAQNFRQLMLSPELQRLPAFGRLRSQVERLDGGALQGGPASDAAAALSEIRSTMDELTRQAQSDARGKRGGGG